MTRAKLSSRSLEFALYAPVFLSGFSSLVFESISNKLLTYLFGVSLTATSLTLITFFIGLSVGGALGGRWVARVRNPLHFYACLEILIAGAVALSPLLYSLADALVKSLAQGGGASVQMLLNILVAVLMVFGPSMLMGATMPAVFQALAAHGGGTAYSVSRIYAVNTMGAAAGVVISSYLLFAWIGMSGSAAVAATANLIAGAAALAASRWARGSVASAAPAAAPGATVEGRFRLPRMEHAGTLRLMLALSLVSGLTTFAYEIAWFNLLALLLGNSVYAFAAMLFTVLIGIIVGSLIADRLTSDRSQLRALVITQLGLPACIYAMLPLWDKTGPIFVLVGFFSRSFAMMELTRLIVAASLLLIPCVLIGVAFPLAVQLGLKTRERSIGSIAGAMYAVNAIGSIAGVLLASLLLINILGTQLTFIVVGTINLTAAAALICATSQPGSTRLRWQLGVIAAFVIARFVWLPTWDIARMTGGENVYFSTSGAAEKVLYHRESTHSGAITVTESAGVKTLFTNGKFEGNDGFEVLDQYLFALIPTVFVKNYDRACNIGLGVGGSLGVLTRFPFKQIDAVDLSPEVFTAARKYFGKVNFNSLDDPRVTSHVTDGRNHLALLPDTYDLISMEISSIWFAGAANLYNREFYQIAHRSLRDQGVFQQWFQLHHISTEDVARVLKTMRSVFPNTSAWIAGHQGVLVGTKNTPLTISLDRLNELDQDPALNELRSHLQGKSMRGIFKHLYLDEEAMETFVRGYEEHLGRTVQISTDARPVLEYSTPMGNADEAAYAKNIAFLTGYRWFNIDAIIAGLKSHPKRAEIIRSLFAEAERR